MNTAARLEAANKQLCSSVMASWEAVERSGMDWWRPMGKIVLRGRATPVEIWEPSPEFPLACRNALKAALDLMQGNRPQALRDITKIVSSFPDDTALQHLLLRLENPEFDDGFIMN
jgi:adenylate cyclase